MSADAIVDPRGLQILQHALGLDQYGRGTGYRNHFVTGPGSKDWDDCRALTEAGLMEMRGGSELSGGDAVFHVTDRGRAAVRAHSPEPPRLTRSQRRYARYLAMDTGMPFGEWLRHDWGVSDAG
ncbi:hypothetical protein [Gaopeijia maritima]|uniref:hypothetical protein n=1 Tax=Gaopeijia maritima TaxID=3119007 RepID=UPI00328DEF6E